MTGPQRTKLAVIGLGMAVTPHAKSLIDLQDRVEVIGCYSRSEDRRRQFAERFDLPVTGDLNRLLTASVPDAALLLTPPNARLELVKRLAAGGTAILMEKPIERTSDAANALVNLCDRHRVALGIVLQHRYRAGAKRLKSLIEGGVLGQLAVVCVWFPWWRPQAYYDEPGRGTLARDGGGVLISQAIHTLDLMLDLAGPVVEVTATGGTTGLHRMETEDMVAAGLRFENGAIGNIMASTACFPGFSERIELYGSQASAVLSPGELVVHHLDGRIDHQGEHHGSGGGADPMDFPHDAHRALIGDFLDALDQGRKPTIDGHEALKVHRLIDALIRAKDTGQRQHLGI
ncbi:MAG: Gfo/Idh/MocA family protein [Geminicoccaceae bacterium]